MGVRLAGVPPPLPGPLRTPWKAQALLHPPRSLRVHALEHADGVAGAAAAVGPEVDPHASAITEGGTTDGVGSSDSVLAETPVADGLEQDVISRDEVPGADVSGGGGTFGGNGYSPEAATPGTSTSSGGGSSAASGKPLAATWSGAPGRRGSLTWLATREGVLSSSGSSGAADSDSGASESLAPTGADGSSSTSSSSSSTSSGGGGGGTADQQQQPQQRDPSGREGGVEGDEGGPDGEDPREAAAVAEASEASASDGSDAESDADSDAAAAALEEAARWKGPVEGALDVAGDPGLMLRLMDVLALGSSSSARGGGGGGERDGGGGGSGAEPGGAAAGVLGTQAGAAAAGAEGAAAPPVARPASPEVVAAVVVGEGRARMRARPPAFCTNCCAPLERLPSGADSECGICGHRAADDARLLPPQPPGGWGSAEAAAAAGAARAEAAEALRRAAGLARAAGVPCCPPARVLLAWHEDSLLHRAMLPPYPERPERLHAVLSRLQSTGLLDVCERLPVEEATDEQLLAVHSAGLVSAVDALCPETLFPEQLALAAVSAALGPESLGNRHTARAARLAAGAAAGMAERLVRGEADAGFALVRPAGHLSSEGSAEGGNLYNSVAVAARAAQRAGAERVLVLDWDAHAAKGTASIFEDDPSVVVVSLHKAGSWFYPGGCPLNQVGRGAASGTTINVAWAAAPRPPTPGAARRGEGLALDDVQPAGGDFLAAVGALVVPLAREWGPDIILVSAGFDSAEGDPVGLGSIPPPVFAHMTAMLRALGPPVGMVLEGGYVLKQTALCVELCTRALLGERPPPLPPGASVPSPVGWHTLARTLAVHQHFWRGLGVAALAAAAASAQGGVAAGAAGGASAAALEALLAAAGAEQGEGEGSSDWEEVDDDGEWEEDEEEGEEEGAADKVPGSAEVEAAGPGEWAGEAA